jgi:hypothetical protein
MVNSEELIGTTEYLMPYTRCRINRCRYNKVILYSVHAVSIVRVLKRFHHSQSDTEIDKREAKTQTTEKRKKTKTVQSNITCSISFHFYFQQYELPAAQNLIPKTLISLQTYVYAHVALSFTISHGSYIVWRSYINCMTHCAWKMNTDHTGSGVHRASHSRVPWALSPRGEESAGAWGWPHTST